MKLKISILLILVIISCCWTDGPEGLDLTWDGFKSQFNRSYVMEFREDRRRKAYEENLAEIQKHNELFMQGKYSFKLSPNSLADLTNSQYLKRYVRLINTEITTFDQDYILGDSLFADKNFPESLDWRTNGFLTPPSNQKSCGSCYAFSITHSIEGQLFKRLNRIIPLSVQQIVDCSVDSGNHACNGGSLKTTLRYLENSGGLMRDSDYPYTASHNKCQYDRDLAVVNVTSWAILPPRNEEAMKATLNEVGPIAVSINASPKTFQLYSNGIYDDPQCSSNTVNHAMLLIGYTKDYWILKNWWGTKWGEGGYMKVKRGINMCGIANYVAYAVV